MKNTELRTLYDEYLKAPKEFRATSYWENYEKQILDTLEVLDYENLRSGKYPVLGTFGFIDVDYFINPNTPFWKSSIIKFIHKYIIAERYILPYRQSKKNIQEIAFHHCEMLAKLTNSISLKEIEVSTYGNPKDIFVFNNKKYSMSFLRHYVRYCYCNDYLNFKGDEIIIELGSGSGYQVELLKKLYPNLTILCFDLPLQLFLAEKYLNKALDSKDIVSFNETLKWKDLSKIEKGKVHFLSNWQMPLLKNFKFNLFWNAASFGEMEPEVVENYLSFIKGNAENIYLFQAKFGKELSGTNFVQKPILFEDYKNMLNNYKLESEKNNFSTNWKFSVKGDYFERVWTK